MKDSIKISANFAMAQTVRQRQIARAELREKFPVTRPVMFSPIRGGWAVRVSEGVYYVTRWAEVLRLSMSHWLWQPVQGHMVPIEPFVTQSYGLADFLRDLQAVGVQIPAEPDSPDYWIERQAGEPGDPVTWRVYHGGEFLGTLYELGARGAR